jgi:cytochrome o ubiquinol oxidase subunit 2
MADEIGSFNGSSANISGEGFAGMKFIAKSTTQSDFDFWVSASKNSQDVLTMNSYQQLSKPSKDNPVSYYVLGGEDIFNETIMKYMMPGMNTKNSVGANHITSAGMQ